MLKQCTQCEQWLELTQFRFLTARNRYMSECKDCERARSRKAQAARSNTKGREVAVKRIVDLVLRYDSQILQEAMEQLRGTE